MSKAEKEFNERFRIRCMTLRGYGIEDPSKFFDDWVTKIGYEKFNHLYERWNTDSRLADQNDLIKLFHDEYFYNKLDGLLDE